MLASQFVGKNRPFTGCTPPFGDKEWRKSKGASTLMWIHKKSVERYGDEPSMILMLCPSVYIGITLNIARRFSDSNEENAIKKVCKKRE